MPGSRGLLVARTASDVRDVLINGPSGIMNVHPPSEMPSWEPSKRLLTWPNGSQALAFSAEVPDALRGPQSEWTLCDEIATWNDQPDASGLTSWGNVRIGTRLGSHPQLFAMTTPKRTPFLRELLDEAARHPERISVRRSRTDDNRGNLSQVYLDTVVSLYEGTSLAVQELDGEMLDNVEGALWTTDLLDEYRVPALPAGLVRPFVVIGVDPSVSDRPRDECGIVVIVGTGEDRYVDRHAYVMEDLSVHGSPSEWAEIVARAAKHWGAVVVAEINQGGALVGNMLKNVDPAIRVLPVHARVGKALRAEPVQGMSQQGRLHMVGRHHLLEDQLTVWDPEHSKKSPDRLDALVHGVLSIITDDSKRIVFGDVRITSSASKRLAKSLSNNPRGPRARTASGIPLSRVPGYMQRSITGLWAPRND